MGARELTPTMRHVLRRMQAGAVVEYPRFSAYPGIRIHGPPDPQRRAWRVTANTLDALERRGLVRVNRTGGWDLTPEGKVIDAR